MTIFDQWIMFLITTIFISSVIYIAASLIAAEITNDFLPISSIREDYGEGNAVETETTGQTIVMKSPRFYVRRVKLKPATPDPVKNSRLKALLEGK